MKEFVKGCVIGGVILLLISILCIILGGLVISGALTYHPSYEKAEKLYERDCKQLQTVVDFITSSSYDEFFIGTTKNTAEFLAGIETGRVQIQDETVVQSIDYLMKFRRYSVIDYSYGTISFQKWTALNHSSGIAYVLDGNSPNIQYMTSYKALPVENWYYYKTNYYEWKSKNAD